jgi:sodium pump decarboxylase gamma subunit
MAEGVVLLIIGMAVVFSFLQLMVLIMNLSAKFFVKFAHWFPEEKKADAAPATEDLTVIAVAIAAVKAVKG